jgi:glycosyltransferase involved in cell wall biosynthesis
MDKLRILILNNRDLSNPNAGGAEVCTHQIAKRWAKADNEVFFIASKFKGGLTNENIDGINIIRTGDFISVYHKAKKLYKDRFRGNIDIVLDEYTLRPFLTPNYVDDKILFICHELAREKYYTELPFPISSLMYHYFEPKWINYYTNHPSIVASDSTKKDLVNLGFSDVTVFPQGLDFPTLDELPEKESIPTMLFVGLLKKSNCVRDLLQIHKYVRKIIPNVRLWIVGRGPEAAFLYKHNDSINIKIFGYVSQKTKIELLTKANVLLAPGIREGWGLVINEANARGTPAIGYDIPGYRDSIKNGYSGLLCSNNPKAMAEEVVRFFSDNNLANYLSNNAINLSKQYSWDNTANVFLQTMKRIID